MRSQTFALPSIVLLLTAVLYSIEARYTVTARILNRQLPVINSQRGDSIFLYNYNSAVVPKMGEDALLVRCQNISNPHDPYSVTQSKLALTKLIGHWRPENIRFHNITQESVVFEPADETENYGTEDPRIVYNPKTNLYYLLYSAVQQYSNGTVISRLALATSPTPHIKSSWKRYGPLFPQMNWSKSGAMLIRDSPPHYLFFGDSTLVPGLQIAISDDLFHWKLLPGLFIEVRNDSFDSILVESGPMPLPLSDGNYLFVYNSARKGYPSKKPNWDLQYNVGWVVLDKTDPTKVIARSSEPLISPTLGWEKGDDPWLGLTPNVVFLEGWRPYPSRPNSFIAYYGGADSVMGAAVIDVHIH
jgi:predicted GH43/DUF377 family glycosyl hydrolase